MERNDMIDKVCEKMCEYYCDDDTCSLNCLLCHNDKHCSRRQSAKELTDELFPEGSVVLRGIDEGTMYVKVTEGSVVLTKEELAKRDKEIKELKIANNNLIFQLQCHDDEVQRLMKENGKLRFERDFAQKIVSKETATNFFKDLIRQANFQGETDMWFNYERLKSVAKEYGVEVEE